MLVGSPFRVLHSRKKWKPQQLMFDAKPQSGLDEENGSVAIEARPVP
jgi:hypothetical protein